MKTEIITGEVVVGPFIYIVPTPIGNLEDITYRAVRILKEANLIVAEDTRVTTKLLKHYAIQTRLTSVHGYNEHKRVPQLIQEVVEKKLVLAVVSDAGTPGVSDPGFLVIREAISQDVPFTCLPGPTAVIPALIMSGLPCERFTFEGFLPHKKGRKSRIEALKNEKKTVVLYESVHRVIQTIQELAENLGNHYQIAVCRELSKKYEQILRGDLVDFMKVSKDKLPEKGEFVIVISPKKAENT